MILDEHLDEFSKGHLLKNHLLIFLYYLTCLISYFSLLIITCCEVNIQSYTCELCLVSTFM